jgi:hypothetical protein
MFNTEACSESRLASVQGSGPPTLPATSCFINDFHEGMELFSNSTKEEGSTDSTHIAALILLAVSSTIKHKQDQNFTHYLVQWFNEGDGQAGAVSRGLFGARHGFSSTRLSSGNLLGVTNTTGLRVCCDGICTCSGVA